MESNNKIYFYPLWLRIWHSIHAVGIILLIITGITMQTGFQTSLIGFQTSVKIHNISGIIITLNYFVYIIGNLVTNNSKFYVFKSKNFMKRAFKQAYYYAWGMFHGMKAPYPLSEKTKFNPLQKYSYLFIMYIIVPFVILSGFALLFPEIIIEEIYNVSGILITALFHSIMGFFISIFLVVHIYMASIAKSPLDNFRSMINGWHHI